MIAVFARKAVRKSGSGKKKPTDEPPECGQDRGLEGKFSMKGVSESI
jgi:hypothetical protein